MSKTRHKHNSKDRAYDDEEIVSSRKEDRRKQKRIDRALRTKNISDLVELDDEGDEYDDYVVEHWWSEDDV